MFSWQCRDVPPSDASSSQANPNLTDLHPIGDQNVNGTMADGYEFYDYENAKTQGTIRLFVAKDTGLPLRIEMADSSGVGGIQMNYAPLTAPANIEVPACMKAK
jgi:outer membrane lipoprotein-sorting protein